MGSVWMLDGRSRAIELSGSARRARHAASRCVRAPFPVDSCGPLGDRVRRARAAKQHGAAPLGDEASARYVTSMATALATRQCVESGRDTHTCTVPLIVSAGCANVCSEGFHTPSEEIEPFTSTSSGPL